MIFQRGVILIICCSCLLLAGAVEIDGDGAVVDYTKVLYNARYFGMGGAGVGSGNDSGVVLLNPAHLGRMQGWELSSTQTKIAGEFTYSYLNFVLPLQNEGFGFSYTYVDPGEIRSSLEVDQYGHPVIGEPIQAYSHVFCLSYGRKTFWDRLFAGITLKNIRKKLATVEGFGNSVDLGMVLTVTPKFFLGVSAKNAFQSGFTYSNTDKLVEVFNPVYVIGTGNSFFNNRFLLSMDYSLESVPKFKIGLEYNYEKMVMLRAGMMHNASTVGVGLRYDLFKIDVGYKWNKFPMENQVYISLTLGDATEKELSMPELQFVVDEEVEND